MAKSKAPSERDQCIAAEILTVFMFTQTMDDVIKAWKRIYKQYELCDDPFTGIPCTFSEFCKSQAEYDKQTMIERYGHCDGLE